MTEKQKIVVFIGVFFLVLAFVFLYRSFSVRDENDDRRVPPRSDTSSVSRPEKPAPVPETPDAIADNILEGDSGKNILDEEAEGESEAAQENVETIHDINNTYDEKSL
ncbi:MAG: hypothetical protein IPL87_00080 [Candidatus Moraniibacteriota bacterium]|nr:MAG: hypothetical protein IPL87_00080 [Candidatus Moranbacteria bacterium]